MAFHLSNYSPGYGSANVQKLDSNQNTGFHRKIHLLTFISSDSTWRISRENQDWKWEVSENRCAPHFGRRVIRIQNLETVNVEILGGNKEKTRYAYFAILLLKVTSDFNWFS